MATYIKGVTDIIPTQAAAQVDWNVISKGLTALQGRYNKGYEQVKSMYNSLINSALSSSDNEEFRQEFLKKADQYLSQMAGVDLANPNNVMQATQVFDPLVNDKQYVRDIYLTKTQKGEINKMLSVKNSTDEKIRGQYNSIMEQYLMIGQERLSQMKRDDGSIEAATPHMFSPWEDPVVWASNIAKEQGLEFKYDYNEGFYKVTEINGGRSLGNYNTWFRNTIGNRFDNQFRIEAQVRTEEAIKGLMSEDPNLDRNSALQKLATDYSAVYTKNYNQEINDVQAAIDDLNKAKRELQKKYPSGIPPAVMQQLEQAKKQKDILSAKLNEMKAEKGTDEEFTKKAIDLFINNPSGAYIPAIRNAYAELFANKQAFGKVSKTREADDVQLRIYLQNDSQAHDWAMKEQDFKNQRILNADKYKYDLSLAKAKGELVGDIGASYGGKQDIGAYDPDVYYNGKVSDLFMKGTQPFTNDKVLAVAANLTIGSGGTVDFDAQGIELDLVQQAIMKKGKSMALSQAEEAALKEYLNLVAPGNNLTVRNMRFSDVQNVITNAVRKNSGNDPAYGQAVWKTINDANVARYQFGQMWSDANRHLEDLVLTDPSYLKKNYVRRNRDGSMSINYDVINKLDKEDREAIYRNVIPRYGDIMSETAKQTRIIELAPADAKKFDYSLYTNAIGNAEKIGVTDAKGNFIEFDKDEGGQFAQFQNMISGNINMSQVFDPKASIQLKVMNGVKYLKVTMPVMRDATKNESMATRLGFDVNGEINKSNKLEVLIPIDRAMNVVGNDRVLKDPISGEIQVMPNKLRELVEDMVSTSTFPESKSWVTENNSLVNGKRVYFPNYLKTNIANGYLYTANNEILARFETDNGEYKILNLTDSPLGVTVDMLNSNPAKYDALIRSYIEQGIFTYGKANIQYKHNQINNNRVEGQTNSSWTKWKDFKW